MQVLPFWSDAHRETKLATFIEHSFDFQSERAKAMVDAIGPDGPPLRFASMAQAPLPATSAKESPP